MSVEAQQQEFRKNQSYRDQYRVALKWLVMMTVIAIGLTATLVYLNVAQKPAKAYATTTSGVIVPLHALNEPVVTNKYILQWASLATRYAFNLSFVGYQQQLQNAQQYFTTDGWSKFMAALKAGKLIQTIESEHVNMSAVVSGTPVILNQWVAGGRYHWRVQFPLLVTFTSASENKQLNLIVTMNIQRVSTLSDAQGVQINDFSAVRPIGG